MSLVFYRERNFKPYLAVPAGNDDASAMLLSNSFCYGQAQAIMLPFTVPGFINPVETVKQMLQFFGWYLIPFIYYIEYSCMTM